MITGEPGNGVTVLLFGVATIESVSLILILKERMGIGVLIGKSGQIVRFVLIAIVATDRFAQRIVTVRLTVVMEKGGKAVLIETDRRVRAGDRPEKIGESEVAGCMVILRIVGVANGERKNGWYVAGLCVREVGVANGLVSVGRTRRSCGKDITVRRKYWRTA